MELLWEERPERRVAAHSVHIAWIDRSEQHLLKSCVGGWCAQVRRRAAGNDGEDQPAPATIRLGHTPASGSAAALERPSPAPSDISPLSDRDRGVIIKAPGFVSRSDRDGDIHLTSVSPTLFGALGVPMVAGWSFQFTTIDPRRGSRFSTRTRRASISAMGIR